MRLKTGKLAIASDSATWQRALSHHLQPQEENGATDAVTCSEL